MIIPVTTLAAVILLYAFVWHDQPARNPDGKSSAGVLTKQQEEGET